MSETFNIKRNDLSPSIRWELEDPDTVLTNATVVFNMKHRGENGEVVINRAPAMVVSSADRPTLGYEWVEGDTAAAGLFEAEFEVTYADGKPETYPNSIEGIPIKIVPDIG